ncbi:MAG TPA: hypothetical protein VG186_03050 [Solirubrobacteraceae bacterium]|nr:hypothetical protein [Solirubrobacteraceae bacterium]
MTQSVPPPSKPDPVATEPAPAAPARNRRPKLLASAALAAVLAGLAFAVFGGSTNRVVDPVAEAATVSSGTAGYRMHLSIEVASSASPTAFTGTGDGTFDLRDRAGSMSLVMNLGNDPRAIQVLGSGTFTVHEIVNGTTVYVKLPAAATSALPLSGKQWIAVDLAKVAGVPGLSSLESNPVSSDPSQILQYLRAVSDSIVSEGRQRVGGLETTHYRANLSLDRVAAALPSADRTAATQALSTFERGTQLHAIPVDVWVDARHLVRRIEMTIAASFPGGQTLNEGMTIDISDYGPQPRPALPTAGEVANLSALIGSGG